MNKEKIEHHIKHLQEQHKKLEKQLKEEELHHGSCAVISILKKNKLKLKDEIESCRKQIV